MKPIYLTSTNHWTRIPKTMLSRSALGVQKLGQIKLIIRKLIDIDIPGQTAEVGVASGGASRVIADCGKRMHYAIDTFTGIPNATGDDVHKNGDFKVDKNEVQVFLQEDPNIVIVEGWFPKCVSHLENERFCFAHIDGDTYLTTKEALEWFSPRMNTGGVMVFDDWKFSNCPGVTRALEEWLSYNNNKTEEAGYQLIVWF